VLDDTYMFRYQSGNLRELQIQRTTYQPPQCGHCTILRTLMYWGIQQSFRSFRKIEENGHQLRHVCSSFRMEQLGSHWTDFHEI